MSFEEYQRKIDMALERAYRISTLRFERAKEACRLAGLDSKTAAFHSERAISAHEAEAPWPHVDYHYVLLFLRQVRWPGTNHTKQGAL